MSTDDDVPLSLRWARLRFAIVGPLLVSPPEHGVLQERFEQLADKSWRHPVTGEMVCFGASTIERWYYAAKNLPADPVGALARRLNAHTGTHPSVSLPLRQAIRDQYLQHPRWSYQLHYDNLVALAEQQPELGPMPSYPTVRRYMKSQGLFKRKRLRRKKHGSQEAGVFEQREQLSFESKYVSALWHLDFHEGSRRVLSAEGKHETVYLLGILDDYSRLCLHLQWYLHESADSLVHGLIQAFLTRDLCNAILSDNGGRLVNPAIASIAATSQTTPRIRVHGDPLIAFAGAVRLANAVQTREDRIIVAGLIGARLADGPAHTGCTARRGRIPGKEFDIAAHVTLAALLARFACEQADPGNLV
jgi:putative transposase